MTGKTLEKNLKGEFVCVVCPNGCFIEAEYTNEGGAKLISLTGNRCERGKDWVRQELETPMRTIATSVPVRGGDFLLASVRTAAPIPLERVADVMREIRARTLDAPLSIGQVVMRNPAGADTEIIVTREVAAK
jgi:CxxC motif-containing protein